MSYGAKLPQELVVDILYRLPTKSLCRFKCVSKSWRTIISDPHFAKTQLNRNNSKCERLILISDCLYSVDCAEASNNDYLFARKLDLLSIKGPEHCEIVGSCNGLILVSDSEGNKFLLNPSTREIRKLLESPFAYNSICGHTMYGLGYDSSANDYKVVAIETRDDAKYDDYGESCCTYTTVSLYSYKNDSWRRIQDVPHYHSSLTPSWLVLVNGFLHWFTFRSSGYSVAVAIVAFDVADEKFHDVQIPSSLDKNDFDSVFYELDVLGGCLCIIEPHNDIPTDIWVMKEYGVTESWTKFSTICVPDMCMMEPLCFLVNGDVLLEIDEKKLVAFNAKEKTSRHLAVYGIPVPYKAGKTYVESLVSPYYNRGCGIERNCEGSENLKRFN